MGNELKLNSAEEAEVILIRLTPEEYPIAYANRVKCLMLSGLSKKEAERMAMKPIDLDGGRTWSGGSRNNIQSIFRGII